MLAPMASGVHVRARAISASEQATIGSDTNDSDSNTTGDPATVAAPQVGSEQAAAAHSTVLDIFSQEAEQLANPLWAIPLASLTATRERPLFSPTRRAPIRTAVAPPPTIVQPDRLTLTLVGAITGENAIAVFRDESTKSVVRLRIGQSHAGWSLERVTQRNATLRRNGELATLALPIPSAQ
jgi:general secretion pathway protein N